MRNVLLIIFSVCTFLVKAQSFYKTPSGSKYHLSTCRMVKNVSEEITADEGIKLGLQPCKICQPQNIYTAGAPSLHKAQGRNTTVQCKGMTKAGNRCKHMTSIGNGYCYQHQPD
jgi:hypothetical protein